MQNFFTHDQVLQSKGEWAPNLRAFARSTTSFLTAARYPDIHSQAVRLAKNWLDAAIDPARLQPHEDLVIVGDEHIHAALRETPQLHSAVFIQSVAWRYWLSRVFDGEAPWWRTVSWSINCPQRIAELAARDPTILEMNGCYLCSEHIGDRGKDTVLELTDNELVASRVLCEWLDS